MSHEHSKDFVACTSKHRTLGQVEWSRQLSRDVAPFFIPQATSESRAQFTSGVDPPRRHTPCLDMERAAPKHIEAAPDPRDYDVKRYEELHKTCAVAIGKSAGRGDVFGVKKHDAETVIEVELHPGWGRGKKSFLPKAPRAPPTPRVDRSETPAFVFSAYTPLPSSQKFGSSPESRLSAPKGGFIPRANERALIPAPQHDALDVQEPRPNVATLNLNSSTRHFAGRSKLSEKYRRMFQTPPPAPLSSPDRPRVVSGFAVQRQSTDRSVSSLLALADADNKRAKKLVMQNFGSGSRSPVRESVLYTPALTTTPSGLSAGSLGSRSPALANTNISPTPTPATRNF